jgi:TPR repeat protein
MMTRETVTAQRSDLKTTSGLSVTSILAGMSAARLQALFAQDPQRTADWVRAAAADGLVQAQLCYGRMLLEGTGTPKDPAAAFTWFERAAARGDLDALNMIGRCFDNGWGTAEDPAAAAVHYRAAADAGYSWALYNLGHLYLDGRGVDRDFAAAYGCYLRAAEQHHERAMNLVARCCEQGWGTPQNLAAAAMWYRRSAEAGYFRGQYNWATLLLKAGRNDEASLWFERAATGGTSAVRAAVIDAITAAGPHEALRDLAVRLTRSA